jgi:hypothetical protein
MHHEEQPNSGAPLESLKARLRALPPPPIPADLEGRLLAAIPASIPARADVDPPRSYRSFRPRPAVWVGFVGALAAACLLAALAWHGRDKLADTTNHDSPDQAQRPVENTRGAGQTPVTNDVTFVWPIEEASPMLASTKIPADLFD